MINNKKHYSITTDRLILKPYCRKYVKQYHSWFDNDSQLLYLTGSQTLSLEQQYANHQSWLQDTTKYTFIVFTKQGSMIGDVNLFFSEWIQSYQAQINIMIAVNSQRGKGYAGEILRYVQAFGWVYYKKEEISAKIKQGNEASKKLFVRNGYVFYEHNQHFGEIEYRKRLNQLGQSYDKLLQGRVDEVADVNQLMGE